jgi:hypothetical protein
MYVPTAGVGVGVGEECSGGLGVIAGVPAGSTTGVGVTETTGVGGAPTSIGAGVCDFRNMTTPRTIASTADSANAKMVR